MFHHNTHHQHDAHAHKHHLPRLPLDDLPPRELASLTAFLIHHILNASAPVVTPVSPMSGSGLTRHSSSSTDTTADNHGHDHDHLVFAPSAQTALAHFLHSVFTVTKVSGAVVVLALKYLQRYARRLVGVDRVSVGESASGVFVSALILANDYLDDNAYTNQTWATVVRVPTRIINASQAQLLQLLHYKLHVRCDEWLAWCGQVERVHGALQARRAEKARMAREHREQQMVQYVAQQQRQQQQQQEEIARAHELALAHAQAMHERDLQRQQNARTETATLEHHDISVYGGAYYAQAEHHVQQRHASTSTASASSSSSSSPDALVSHSSQTATYTIVDASLVGTMLDGKGKRRRDDRSSSASTLGY